MAEKTNEKQAKLILISIIAAICFNFPILRILGGPQLIGGIPKFYFSLFLIWLLIILLSYLALAEQEGKHKDQN
jgi:hypothetical protein